MTVVGQLLMNPLRRSRLAPLSVAVQVSGGSSLLPRLAPLQVEAKARASSALVHPLAVADTEEGPVGRALAPEPGVVRGHRALASQPRLVEGMEVESEALVPVPLSAVASGSRSLEVAVAVGEALRLKS